MTADESRPRFTRILLCGIGLIFLTGVYLLNWSSASSPDFFDSWQLDSEGIVLHRIEADLLDRSPSPLGLLWADGAAAPIHERMMDPSFPLTVQSASLTYRPYESMVGGYAHALSWLFRNSPLASTARLHLVNSGLMAVVALGMFWAFLRVSGKGLAWAWLATAVSSPWLVAAGKNLYWTPWLWFVPALAATILAIAKGWQARLGAVLLVWMAFFAKYLATGYEVFTSLTLLAMSMPIIYTIFHGKTSRNRRTQIVNALWVAIASATAFIAVLLIHARLLAPDIESGLRQIWVETVLRRTYGDQSNFDPIYAESLTANSLNVVWRYVFGTWSTDFLAVGDSKLLLIRLGWLAFPIFIVVSALITLLRAYRGDMTWRRDFALLAMGFFLATSWFLAAKGHSYIHTHILFFLWYLLFVPVLLYVPARYAYEKRGAIRHLLPR